MGGRYTANDIQLSAIKVLTQKGDEDACKIIIDLIAETQWLGMSHNEIKDDITSMKQAYQEDGLSKMYLLTGVEIGLLIAELKHGHFESVSAEANRIIDSQCIGSTNEPMQEHIAYLKGKFGELTDGMAETDILDHKEP